MQNSLTSDHTPPTKEDFYGTWVWHSHRGNLDAKATIEIAEKEYDGIEIISWDYLENKDQDKHHFPHGYILTLGKNKVDIKSVVVYLDKDKTSIKHVSEVYKKVQ